MASNSFESNQAVDIEQSLYNLSEDFTRQTQLNDTCSIGGNGWPSSTESTTTATERLPGIGASSMHSFADILRRPIADDMLKKLCFSETLLVCDGNEKVVGGAAINVSSIAGEILAAFSSTRLSFHGQSTAESELMSFADRNCRPLQERKCETVRTGATRQEKQIQLYFDDRRQITAYRQQCNGLHSESFQGVLIPDGGDTTAHHHDHHQQRAMLLPDGLQLLLLRYLILSNFVGEICSQTIDIQGRVGNCVHKISAAVPIPQKQSGKTSESIKEVRKTIWYPEDPEPEESISHYSAAGRLLRHCWTNANYVLISNPLGSLAPSPVVELERGIKDYVKALMRLIDNGSSISDLMDDIQCTVAEMHRFRNMVNPVLIDLIKEI
ncbi:tektin [Anopheles darlingi]|uniref:Tektin n=1 Tax=Anopheles darlingi TaxID=43151 RepID=W5JW27_ANODA|nr:tektin [Anopheles darlingi]